MTSQRMNVSRMTVGITVVAMLFASMTRGLSAAEEGAAKAENPFLRFVPDEPSAGGKLETSIITYRNADGARVHLVGAVHVGDGKYYKGLKETFKGYDALLYEMVKPEGMEVPQPGAAPRSGVSFLQHMLKNVLALQFQLDAIDYSAPNFVHADLDAETFVRMQEERGESLMGLMLQTILDEMFRKDENAKPPELQTAELFAALASPDRPRQFKLILARQFENLDSKIAGLDGPEGSVLLTERNKAAIAVLKQRLEKGDKEVGIFYGAAHMRDMEKWIKEMGFEKEKSEWRTAWDMTQKPVLPATTRAATKAVRG